MRSYPPTFPCPMIEGYQYTVQMGVIRSEGGSTRYEQRRVHRSMPHIITASFMLKSDLWGTWQSWMNDFGYGWFEMPNLPTMYSGVAVVRLIADTMKVKARTQEYFKIDIQLELSPSMYLQALEAP